VGVPVLEADRRYYNAVVSLGTSPTQGYAKSHLVPFGEFVPPGFGWIVAVLTIPLSDFARGSEGQRPLQLAGQRVALNICYEDAFGPEIIRQLPEATLLVNVSNVAWFGDSLAPAQHLRIARMRSLETGRYMLRATNTGVTAIVDPRGAVAGRLPSFTEGVLEGSVQGYEGSRRTSAPERTGGGPPCSSPPRRPASPATAENPTTTGTCAPPERGQRWAVQQGWFAAARARARDGKT
jgi:apolipoprotein N-acyltransferase